MMIDKLENKKIVLYTHNDGGTGNYNDELFDFLLKNSVKELIKADFPFGRKSEKPIRVKKYLRGKLDGRFESKIKFSHPEFISYVKDFIHGVYYGFVFLKNTDIFFGMDNLLALIGLIFKKIGFVKKVVYVVIDYSPRRYKFELLDKFYFFMDRICLYNSDYVMSLNNQMIEGRIKDRGLDKSKINWIIAPFGNHSLSRSDSDYDNYDRRRIVYFGGVSKSTGSGLFVPIVKSLTKKGFNDFSFNIIGRINDANFTNDIKHEGLEKYFNIYGRVDDSKEVEKILLSSSLALAPYYVEDKNSFSYYSDPGKIKFYLGCGLPIIITDVPPIAKIIQERRCGVISEYNPEIFADKIIDLIKDKDKYDEYRKNSIELGREFDWNLIFEGFFYKIC